MTSSDRPYRPCQHSGCTKPGRWQVYGDLLCDDHGLTDSDRRRFGVRTESPAARPRGGKQDEQRTESLRAEARRRGVSIWQVRKERGATWSNPGTKRPGRPL